jgi:hypothetical protein
VGHSRRFNWLSFASGRPLIASGQTVVEVPASYSAASVSIKEVRALLPQSAAYPIRSRLPTWAKQILVAE